MTDDRREKDLDLFNTWKETGDKKALGQLVTQLHPLIYSEVKRASGTLPSAALLGEAKKWTIRALQTYDPKYETAVGTHVTSYLRKIRRLNAKYQNIARLPENWHYEHRNFETAMANLRDQLNREPTDKELAKELGWKPAQVNKYKDLQYADLLESGSTRPSDFTEFNRQKILLDYIMSQLSPEEKTILENAKTMSSPDLAKKLGVDVNRLNYLKTKLRQKISQIQEEADVAGP